MRFLCYFKTEMIYRILVFSLIFTSVSYGMDWKNQSEEFWKKRLSSEQYSVCREGGTEKPFSGKLYHNKKKGQYYCSSCGAKLFRSDEKYDSGTGWPSFWKPTDPDPIEYHSDDSFGMKRTEVRCKACGAHLGHVFEDGPPPTGKRYCINSVCLNFKEDVPKEKN